MSKTKAKEAEKRTVVIEVPIGAVADASFKIHIDGDLPPRHANALRKIVAGLNGKLGIFSSDGRVKNTQAIRYILELVASQLDDAPPNEPDESRQSGNR